MAQRGEDGGYKRIEALMAVARLSMADADFLGGLRSDLDRTLWRYGFALSPVEMEDAREYFSAKARDHDDEIKEALRRDLDSVADPSFSAERARYWRLS